MNKTKIEYADFTWNPVVGCKNGCPYCYARRIRKRFNPDIPFEEITFYWERLASPFLVKRPSRIFVGSMTDMFAKWMPKAYATRIVDVAKQCPQHTFIFLTKSPEGYKRIRKYPKNCWLGVTTTGKWDWYKAKQMHELKRDNLKFVSVEPILDEINSSFFYMVDWIILGGLTPKPVHKNKWIERFLKLGKGSNIPVFMKSNLGWKGKLRQEFPK